ncbi:piggyBac transposable element-derived protein 4-like [Stegodyphus dumicola]|uniref:piggyBac transposable element-derived protein 4-like n=1 Tax=Stegodyphus dumicola TaxID=202533 RepID=UPI0015A8C111|nr:piggyBac transposable element-derived protein 4-like [Stegodyphus dumicola]
MKFCPWKTNSPIALFLFLFDMVLMENVVFQTNLYATQKDKPFNSLNLNELLKFLGINLLMGIKRIPSYRDYWSSTPEMHDAYISDQMSVKRFTWILSHLHLNDNTVQPQRGSPEFDKLYKSVDESMIKFKGRCSLKQYMPKKPIKRGYKVWMQCGCDESGFVCQFDIYTGKTVNMNRKNLPKNLKEEKVLGRGDFDFSVSSDKITCIKWKHKRCVNVLSNQNQPTEILQVQRKEKDGNMKNIPCPKAIVDYNNNMGFVDHFDHLKMLRIWDAGLVGVESLHRGYVTLVLNGLMTLPAILMGLGLNPGNDMDLC